MSETAIFVVGAIIFAITVYGVVVAGGLAMTREFVEQNPSVRDGTDAEERKKRFPFRLKF